MSRDPIAERGGLNLYGFVLNHPVDAIDRIGLEITYYYGLVGVNIDRGWNLHNRAGTVPYLTGESATENFVAGAYNTLPTVLNSAEALFVLGADTLGALIEGAKDFTRWRFHLDAKWDMMLDGIGNAVPILLPEARFGRFQPKIKCQPTLTPLARPGSLTPPAKTPAQLWEEALAQAEARVDAAKFDAGGFEFQNMARRNTGGGAITAEQALDQAQNWLGAGYREIAPGVFRSADDLRQFRMTTSDLTDLTQGAHVHFESIGPDGRIILENSHVRITNP
jgi:hypothetical protein